MSISPTFLQDTTQMPAGMMLLLSLLLVQQRRVTWLLGLATAQAWVVATTACWLGWVHGLPGLVATGLLSATAQGVAVPLALRLMIRRQAIRPNLKGSLFSAIFLGLLLVLAAYVAMLPAGGAIIADTNVAAALAIMLLGLLLMIFRQQPIPQLIGFLSLQNGLMLAAIGTSTPIALILAIASLALGAIGLAGLFLAPTLADALAANSRRHPDGQPE